MRNKENKHLGLEIDPELHYKIKFACKYLGRSISGLAIYLFREFIESFESKHGKIEVKLDEIDKL